MNFAKKTQKHLLYRTPTHNLGQKVGDKFIKLRNIDFSMECFTADFLQFFIKKRQNLTFGWTAEYSPLNSNISGIFFKLPNFLSLPNSFFFSCVGIKAPPSAKMPWGYVVRQLVRQLVHSLSGDNNLVSFHL